jgi:dolichol-phosphate mannosyltransferase
VHLTVVIPARNERAAIGTTVHELTGTLQAAGIGHDILIVNDHSTDGTEALLEQLAATCPAVRWIANDGPPGFGYAVRLGLHAARGEAICVMMADASDDPADLLAYHRALVDGADCAFGSRFIRGAHVDNYPWLKLALNRAGNTFIGLLFGFGFNDYTNAFKCYRRHVVDGLAPLLACHFNLTVELPLKAIVRGYSYAVIPIRWRGRTTGASKFRIKEMGSRYLFIILYVLLEKWLSRGDYHR